MNRAAVKRWAFLALAGSAVLAAAAVFVWRPWQRTQPVAHSREAVRTGARAALGGETVLLEIFTAKGRLLWLIDLRQVKLGVDNTVSATGVRAEYHGTKPASELTSPEVVYYPARSALSFRGGIHLTGPEIDLTGAELTWDDHSRSISLTGGYALTRAGSRMEGERLWADQDFQIVKALGAVRLRSVEAP